MLVNGFRLGSIVGKNMVHTQILGNQFKKMFFFFHFVFPIMITNITPCFHCYCGFHHFLYKSLEIGNTVKR